VKFASLKTLTIKGHFGFKFMKFFLFMGLFL